MFLAIVTDVYEHDTEKGFVRRANALPIQTGDLHTEITSRVKGRLTRWLAEKILTKPLQTLEHDTKIQTINLSLNHG